MYVNYAATRNIITSHIANVELVVNGDMSSSTGWTLNTGWSVAAGVLTGASAFSTAQQVPVLASGALYDASIDVISIGGSGQIDISIAAGAATSYTTTGVKTAVITAGAVLSSGIEIAGLELGGSGYTGDLDDFSIKLASSNTWALEFNAVSAPRNPTTNKIEVMSLDETTQTIVINSSGMTYSVTTELVAYGSAVWLQFMEFFNSVREGESFSFDWRGTVASPDNLETVKLVGNYTETYVDADLYRFSFTVRVQ